MHLYLKQYIDFIYKHIQIFMTYIVQDERAANERPGERAGGVFVLHHLPEEELAPNQAVNRSRSVAAKEQTVFMISNRKFFYLIQVG